MQKQKIQMRKRKFRIGELAKKLKLKKFVIRFWEKEFELNSDRSDGGQRFYTQEDLNTFVLIKDLLYEKKYTIPGAKKELTNIKTNIKPAVKTNSHDIININLIKKIQKPSLQITDEILKQLSTLKEKLIKFKKLLQ